MQFNFNSIWLQINDELHTFFFAVTTAILNKEKNLIICFVKIALICIFSIKSQNYKFKWKAWNNQTTHSHKVTFYIFKLNSVQNVAVLAIFLSSIFSKYCYDLGVRDKIIDCLYVYLLYFLCATHDLLFLFSCYFIRDACTARMCVWMDYYLYFRHHDREYLLYAYCYFIWESLHG